MNPLVYNNISLIMRYIFDALMLFIIANVLLRSAIESRYARKAREFIGLDVKYIEIIEPSEYSGRRFECTEGIMIGSDTDCDVCL